MALVLKVCTLQDIDGNAIPGRIGECEACGSRAFVITFVPTQDHPHFQCVDCHESYCGTWDGTQCHGMEQ